MPSVDPTLVDPCIFWFWNATPTHAEIDARLDAFLAKGFRGVYVHPMPDSFRPGDFHGGMKVEYLSPDFFELISYTCRALASRDMIMWLYDEGGWPSGMAGGRVVRESPEFGIWVLEKSDDGVRSRQLLDEIAYPDLMNPAATDCFIRHTHEKYRACIGERFGTTVRGIFTDEARLIGCLGTDRIPFSPLLPEAFQRDHGYDLSDVQAELFLPRDKDVRRTRIHRNYLRTMSRLIAQNYYQRIADWCSRNNLLFEGHHSGEDDFARHGQYFGNYLEQARHYHIPGADTIWRQVFPGQTGGNYVQLASSAAWLKGSRVAVSESFAVYGAGLTLEQMKWIAAFQLVRGVNKIGAMASLHSTRGPRRISVCSELSPKNPIWRDIDLWTDFVRRAARFTLRGQPIIRAAVVYRTELLAPERAVSFTRRHEAICDWLHDQLIGWMFVELADIEKLSLALVAVHIDSPLDDAEVSSILAAARTGTRIIWCGEVDPPVELREFVEAHDANGLTSLDLQYLSPVRTDRPASGIRLLTLREADWRGYLLFNQNDTPVSFAFRAREVTSLRIHPLDAQLPPAWCLADGEDLQITLAPGEMRAYESTQCESGRHLEKQVIPLHANWTCQSIESFVVDEDITIRKSAEPSARTALGDVSEQNPAFSGSLACETTFELPENINSQKVVLDLGLVHYSAEVWCNGQSVGRRAWQPYWFDLSGTLNAGTNTLRVRVTNTLANQWASPEVRLRDQAQGRNMYLEKVSPYIDESLHLGIIGPVVLRVF